jgi:hypothetical protein
MRDPFRRDMAQDVVIFSLMYGAQIAGMAAAVALWTMLITLLAGAPPAVPLAGSAWDYVFVGGLFGVTTAGYLAGAYAFLRHARRRYDERTVFDWLTLGPRVPVMTDLLCRMYAGVYGVPVPVKR